MIGICIAELFDISIHAIVQQNHHESVSDYLFDKYNKMLIGISIIYESTEISILVKIITLPKSMVKSNCSAGLRIHCADREKK